LHQLGWVRESYSAPPWRLRRRRGLQPLEPVVWSPSTAPISSTPSGHMYPIPAVRPIRQLPLHAAAREKHAACLARQAKQAASGVGERRPTQAKPGASVDRPSCPVVRKIRGAATPCQHVAPDPIRIGQHGRAPPPANGGHSSHIRGMGGWGAMEALAIYAVGREACLPTRDSSPQAGLPLLLLS